MQSRFNKQNLINTIDLAFVQFLQAVKYPKMLRANVKRNLGSCSASAFDA